MVEVIAADTWSTARRLLRDRDVLWLQGWRGQALTARLRQLARATRSALPGLPDRIQAVVIELDRRQTDIELIELTTPSLRRGPGWREVFLRLERQGVTITTVEPGGEQASGDLGGAQAGAFIPRGDGTLQLLRPHGPAEAAEEVAAWLAARTSLYRP